MNATYNGGDSEITACYDNREIMLQDQFKSHPTARLQRKQASCEM
uniref:Uncharacterized protein n=1 Tax=Heterorhabditis bacteriophora TaxID=37862 RepID=A0A1I7XB47_HETBA